MRFALPLIIIISLFLFPIKTSAQRQQLSSDAEISLLSCAQGYEVYSAYGHSALRIKDPKQKLDIVFNYGTFDFNTDYFVPKFIRGTLDYSLSKERFEWFFANYIRENRSVVEQVLNLSLVEKQALYKRLIVNYETDERLYRYDFFYDNCSTRIHEILKEVLGTKLIYAKDINEESKESFRELIAPYTTQMPWTEFGIGIIMGYPTDDIATKKQKMFLPDHMMAQFDLATLSNKALVKTKRSLFKAAPIDHKNNFLLKPLFVFSCVSLLIISISILNYVKQKHFYWIDYSLFFLSGLIGVFFIFMWIGTRHTPTYVNMNMFWAMPLNLIAVFFFKNQKIKIYLFLILTLNLLGFFILPQVFHIAIFPICLLMAVRYWKLYLQLKIV